MNAKHAEITTTPTLHDTIRLHLVPPLPVLPPKSLVRPKSREMDEKGADLERENDRVA